MSPYRGRVSILRPPSIGEWTKFDEMKAADGPPEILSFCSRLEMTCAVSVAQGEPTSENVSSAGAWNAGRRSNIVSNTLNFIEY